MKSCFMFGHRDAPDGILEKLIFSVEQLYTKHNITIFYIGGYGMFDRYAGAAVKTVRGRFPDISLYRVPPYHPAIRPIILPEGYDGSFYPPLANVPAKYAIPKANQYMVRNCDAILCYVKYCGNSKTLLELAISRAKKPLIIENIGECFCTDSGSNRTKHEPRNDLYAEHTK